MKKINLTLVIAGLLLAGNIALAAGMSEGPDTTPPDVPPTLPMVNPGSAHTTLPERAPASVPPATGGSGGCETC